MILFLFRIAGCIHLQNIDTHNVVVNQLLFPEEDENGHIKCKKCNARYSIQNKYLEQVNCADFLPFSFKPFPLFIWIYATFSHWMVSLLTFDWWGERLPAASELSVEQEKGFRFSRILVPTSAVRILEVRRLKHLFFFQTLQYAQSWIWNMRIQTTSCSVSQLSAGP